MALSHSGLLHTVFLCFLWSLIQLYISLSDAQKNICPEKNELFFGPCKDMCTDHRNCTGFAACCYQGCRNEEESEKLKKEVLFKVCINRDLCQEGVCENNGTCESGLNGEYICICKPGYTGKNCSYEIDECDSNPCKYGGECHNLLANYSCCCPPGRTGKNCETELQCQNSAYLIDRCLNKTCKNVKGAMCIMEYKFVVKNKNGEMTDVTDQCSP